MKTILILFALSIPPPRVAHPIPEPVNEKRQESALWKGCAQTALDIKTNTKSFICTDKKDRRFEIKVTPLFDVAVGEW